MANELETEEIKNHEFSVAGSAAVARVVIKNHSEAQTLQDLASEKCSMTYRPPELFQVPSECDIDERTDVWVKNYVFSVFFYWVLICLLFQSLGCLLYAMCFFKSPYDAAFEKVNINLQIPA